MDASSGQTAFFSRSTSLGVCTFCKLAENCTRRFLDWLDGYEKLAPFFCCDNAECFRNMIRMETLFLAKQRRVWREKIEDYGCFNGQYFYWVPAQKKLI